LLGEALSSQWRSKLGWEEMKGDGCRRGSGLELGSREGRRIPSLKFWAVSHGRIWNRTTFLGKAYDSLLVVLCFLLSRRKRVELLSRLFVLDGRSRIFSYGLRGWRVNTRGLEGEVLEDAARSDENFRCLLFVLRVHLTTLLDLCQDICCRMWFLFLT